MIYYIFTLFFCLLYNDGFSNQKLPKAKSEKKSALTKIENKEKAKVQKVIRKFVHAIINRDYALLKTLVSEREAKIYNNIKDLFLLKNDQLNQLFKKYFSLYKGFSCDFTYVDLKLKKAISMCHFSFNSENYKSKSEKVTKVRLIDYYLSKKGNEWKIVYSKLKNELIYIGSKKNNLKVRK